MSSPQIFKRKCSIINIELFFFFFVNIDAFNVSISQIGLLSSAPNLCNLLGMVIGAQIADFLFNRSAISNSKVRSLHFLQVFI